MMSQAIMNIAFVGRRWGLLMALLWVFGCSTLPRSPVPVEQMSRAQVAGMPGVRAWAGEIDPNFQRDMIQSVRQEPPGMFPQDSDGSIAYSTLAISGGGENGAFGAGFLNGWTKTGIRPTFKLVTGISTGALTAPFAFLGPEYDETLKALYTGISAKDIYKERGILSALGSESFADASPLANLIAKVVDDAFLKRIASAHGQGRRLYIGTTNLDAERFVIWNMGLIASSGQPKALELFRKIMLASASVPIVFPPVYIDVEVDGKSYDEMHVDGGTKTQVFFYGAVLDLRKAAEESGVNVTKCGAGTVYIIRNGILGPEAEPVQRKLVDIAGRTVSAMVKSSAMGDIYRIYAYARRDGIDINYTGIPEDYEWVSEEEFDPVEMKRLYELGYKTAVSGNPWFRAVPGLAP